MEELEQDSMYTTEHR